MGDREFCLRMEISSRGLLGTRGRVLAHWCDDDAVAESDVANLEGREITRVFCEELLWSAGRA
jgi:hypothetical protein